MSFHQNFKPELLFNHEPKKKKKTYVDANCIYLSFVVCFFVIDACSEL